MSTFRWSLFSFLLILYPGYTFFGKSCASERMKKTTTTTTTTTTPFIAVASLRHARVTKNPSPPSLCLYFCLQIRSGFGNLSFLRQHTNTHISRTELHKERGLLEWCNILVLLSSGRGTLSILPPSRSIDVRILALSLSLPLSLLLLCLPHCVVYASSATGQSGTCARFSA